MIEITNLSHSFATKVEEQSSEVETLFTQVCAPDRRSEPACSWLGVLVTMESGRLPCTNSDLLNARHDVQAEQTSENLVRGNTYLDSAAKHSRDFRLMVLTLLLVASFSLLFLDWYYE